MKPSAEYKAISRYTPSEKREGKVQSTLSAHRVCLFPKEHKPHNGSRTMNKPVLFLFKNSDEGLAGISLLRRCRQGLLHEAAPREATVINKAATNL